MKPRAALVALALLAMPALALACPACKNALADDPGAMGFNRGIYHSIVLMLGVFFGLVGFFVWKLVRLARQDHGAGSGR
ncbi:MAG TPA: hypothetical protein VNZ67_07675 [bacterium]|jgi:hypothetical protein|nr:hypothetical protein [bacterium]